MEDISVSEAVKKEKISERRVQNLNVSMEEIVEKYNAYNFRVCCCQNDKRFGFSCEVGKRVRRFKRGRRGVIYDLH